MRLKPKISHEFPKSLLEESKEINDYDFCLPHLMDQDEKYREFFLRCRDEGREIYLDNSLHELGEAYSTDRLLHWVNTLKPTNFFIPDVWQDKDASCRNAKEWSKIILPKETTKIAVVQAKTINEAFICVQTYKDLGYKKIAFSYGGDLYNEICPHPNKDYGKALGRLQLISNMYNQGMLTKYDRVHLLGCSVPQEFTWYRGIECIESIDTSNPVMATLDGTEIAYTGLINKPKSCMNDNFETPKIDINLQLLNYNTTMFKTFL